MLSVARVVRRGDVEERLLEQRLVRLGHGDAEVEGTVGLGLAHGMPSCWGVRETLEDGRAGGDGAEEGCYAEECVHCAGVLGQEQRGDTVEVRGREDRRNSEPRSYLNISHASSFVAPWW